MTTSKPTTTLHTKIAGESASVKVIFEFIEDTHLTIRVSSREEAFICCYCYRTQTTEINRAADGGWLVIVRK